jgi:hypothetical protein
MRRLLRTTALLIAAATAGDALAHHSIASAYDSKQRITVEGRVTAFEFVNPHPLLIIEVTADGGVLEEWRLEMDNRSELVDIGIDAETFAPGDRVVASGSAARGQERALYLLRLDRGSDGLRYEQMGYRPAIEWRRRR